LKGSLFLQAAECWRWCGAAFT